MKQTRHHSRKTYPNSRTTGRAARAEVCPGDTCPLILLMVFGLCRLTQQPQSRSSRALDDGTVLLPPSPKLNRTHPGNTADQPKSASSTATAPTPSPSPACSRTGPPPPPPPVHRLLVAPCQRRADPEIAIEKARKEKEEKEKRTQAAAEKAAANKQQPKASG